MAEYDAVLVGSGINSLVAGAMLARGGWSVCVLERNDYLGGAIKTAEITQPGFRHDVFSGWHPLFVGSAAYAELGEDLRAQGLEYLNTTLPTGSVYPDGESAFLSTSQEDNVAELDRFADGDGAAWERVVSEFMPNADVAFGVMGTELWSPAGLRLALGAYRRMGARGALEFVGSGLSTCRDWLSDNFRSPRAHGLLAPWVLHTGLGPDAAASGFMTQVIAVALQMGGMPVPRGGGARLVDALVAVIRKNGGRCETGADVGKVLVSGGRAVGVLLRGGEAVMASGAVICNVTPTQLYTRLLEDGDVPSGLVRQARRFRYGRAGMQIHMALSEPPRWDGDERLGHAPMVHVTPGLDGVSRAVNEADRGLLPAEATVVCGQPLAVDPSRAPEGKGLLWIQLQELPSRPKGDAAGEIEIGDGVWTESLRERYADRIQSRLARHVPNLESALLERVVLSPADLQEANINLVGGDPYSGSLTLDQNFLWRPLAGQPSHRTPIAGLYHVGASTHPGPGLGGVSGTLVAKELLLPPIARRLLQRVPLAERVMRPRASGTARAPRGRA
ncbi:NAD(P)-binding protein [Rubrobacter marinus]|uniref:Pyridine nucleotide-disulfide oxidoreductase domain-containing protein 2 n=1 Tax=Rubrobacter marinus TaxID=2653852 RepID=A0A6G8Q0R8_9ACTN|nr:NAD(P)/FAD-dependent oxidoreductase [Rubrobacter marinus]QIN80089.1 NAD(P)-binding protein [Rubrobacter marinus]